ncbi:MAG: O-antigen ligase family protein [Phycisphaerae bacterium]|nr:O-antigen ligase family protein [Phycisphaerae bacterium]
MSVAAYAQPGMEMDLLDYPETQQVLTRKPGFVDWLFGGYLLAVSATDVARLTGYTNIYFFFLLVILVFSAKSHAVERMPEFWIIVGLMVWNYITAFVSAYFELSIRMAWYETRILGGYLVLLTVCNSLPKLRLFFLMQVLGTLFLSAMGAIVGFGAVEMGGERVTAAEAEPNAFGWQITYAVFASLIVLPLVGRFWKTVIFVFFGTATLALLAAGSRGSAIASFSVLVFYYLLEHVGSLRANWKAFLPVAVMITIPIIVAVKFFPHNPLVARISATIYDPGSEVAFAGRDVLIIEAFGFFLSHPVFGIGVGAYAGPTGGRSVAAHNAYFELLSTTGIVGFSLYFLMVGLAYARARRLAKTFSGHNRLRKMFKAVQASILGILVLCFFNEVNLRKLPNMQLAMMIGLCVRLLWAVRHDTVSGLYGYEAAGTGPTGPGSPTFPVGWGGPVMAASESGPPDHPRDHER